MYHKAAAARTAIQAMLDPRLIEVLERQPSLIEEVSATLLLLLMLPLP